MNTYGISRATLRQTVRNLLARSGMTVVTAGLALFILLPVTRLILMSGVFPLRRDYRFGAVAALALVIMSAGLLARAA